MSIETAVFAVQRGDQQFSCKGSELIDKLTDGDLFAIQRGDTLSKGSEDKVQDTDLITCTDTDGVTYKVTGAQFKGLFEEEELEPLILIEDPTINVNSNTFTVEKDSVVTGGKPSYTYENEWFGTKLVETSNNYKSYTVGINNKGQAVLPTSTIETVPKPVAVHYYTVDAGVTWQSTPSDFGAKGEVAWNEEEKCFVCGFIGRGSDTSKEGPRLVYPESPEKNKYLHLDTPKDLDDGLERFYGVRAHPSLPNTYTVATSGSPASNSATIVMFEIDFEAGTATYIQSLGPTRDGTSYARHHGEYNGIGYIVVAENSLANIGKLYLNEEGLFSTNQRKWIKHSFQYSDWAQVCFIQDTIYVSKVRGSLADVYEFDGNRTFTKTAENEFWRQIGDYVYKASKFGVDQVSCIDGSVKQIATYDQASSNPTFLDYAGGDLAVVFNNGSVKFSDNGTVVGTDDSITSTEAVTLKQTVTDQNGEFVVGSATAEPAYVETPFTVSSPHRWLSSINSGVEQNEDVSFYPVVFEGGHPLSNYNRYQINAVTDEGTVLYNGVYDNSGSRKKFKVKKPGETFRVTYTATCNDYSLEVVTDPVNIIHEKPWKGWPGGVFHIRGVTDNNKIINLGDISLTVYMIENNQVQALSGGVTQIQISKTREAVVCAYAQTSGIFSNNNNEFVFGEFTDISRTNTLNRLLFNCSAFNDPSIASWSVNNITNMNQMFGGCSAFNQDITRWDVQNVSNMNYMFQDCSSFNQDLSNWCVYRFTEEPDGFSSGTDSWSLPKPPWGSCGQN